MGSPLGAQKIAAQHHGLSLEEYQARLDAGLKWCSAGEHWIPQVQFSKDRSRSAGLSARCKGCDKAHYTRRKPRQRELDAQNRAHINARMREWRSKPENAERVREEARRYYQDNREACQKRGRSYYERNREKCKATSRAARLKKYEHYLVKRLQRRAKAKGLPFDLDPEDILIPEVCPVLGIPITKEGRGQRDGAPSVDRLVPNRGYVRGNIKVISMRANQIKNCASIEEVERVLAYMKEHVNDDTE